MDTFTAADTIQAFDEAIQARHLLTHPFYKAWTKGELTRQALRDYARQYYHHVAAFPTYLSAVHAHCDDLEVRKQILQNLMDEEAGSPNHPELWMQFAEGLGLERQEVEQTELWPETRSLVDTFRRVCASGSVERGLSALYAYESQIPPVAESKIEGLETHYDLADEKTLEYFQVHEAADREHSAVERRLLEDHLSAETAQECSQAVDQVLDALWEMLSGVCRRHQIEC